MCVCVCVWCVCVYIYVCVCRVLRMSASRVAHQPGNFPSISENPEENSPRLSSIARDEEIESLRAQLAQCQRELADMHDEILLAREPPSPVKVV